MAAADREITVAMRRPHAGQRRVLAGARRFNVLACGRRLGKTELGVDLVVDRALRHTPVGWFAPTYKLLAEAWRTIRAVARPATLRVSEAEHRLELYGGGVVEAWSLDGPDPARGRKYGLAVLDEASLVPHLDAAWNGAIRPTLADLCGDAWFLGTPKGRNYFWQLYLKGLDPSETDWASFSIPTSANPFISPAELEAIRAATPARWYAQEYLAEFIDDAGGVFRGVTEAATATAQLAAVPGHSYVIGVDWGKSNDFTVCTVVDLETRELVELDRYNRVDYTLQVGRVEQLAQRFRPLVIVPERNSMGEPLCEDLVRRGLPVTPFLTTSASKAAAIEALALAIERRDLALLPDPVLLGELQAFEATRLPSGLMRYAAPEGVHDDCVMALAMAWQAVVEAEKPRAWWAELGKTSAGAGVEGVTQ